MHHFSILIPDKVRLPRGNKVPISLFKSVRRDVSLDLNIFAK